MNFKNIFIVFLLSSLFFWYTMVYSSFYKDNEITYVGTLSKNIYLDSNKLNNIIVIFKSLNDISNYEFSSVCNIKTEFLYNFNSNYFFNIQILDKNCKNGNIFLKDIKGNIFLNTNIELNIINNFDLYNKYSDYNDNLLNKINKIFSQKKDKMKFFASIVNFNFNFDFIKKTRFYDEINYNNLIVEEIISKRKEKYQIPILGYDLPDGTKPSKLPNTPRPYRANYTNAIHEGWDIDTRFGEKVVSIDDGIIIKIISDFQFENLNKIKKGNDLNQDDKVNNLDILRGNQVWIKTMKGDIIFFSHLGEVNSNLKIGDKIKKGQFIGTVGTSGIPFKNYKDYHLHFELRKNPYLKAKVGKNTYKDYMNWDWYFKGKSKEYILENQYTIFQKRYE